MEPNTASDIKIEDDAAADKEKVGTNNRKLCFYCIGRPYFFYEFFFIGGTISIPRRIQ